MEMTFYIENLGCANCAAKMEAKMNELPQVEQALIVFPTKQLRLKAEDPAGLLPELNRIARRYEPEVTIHPLEEKHHCHDSHCDCGHHHDHEEHCGCGHHHNHEGGCHCGHHHDHSGQSHDHGAGEGLWAILLGAGLFAAGLLLELVSWPWIKYVSMTIFAAAYLLLGWPVLKTAAKNVRHGLVFDENFLMSLATIGAICIGEFPEAVGVMLFYRVGEYFEHRAVERSRKQILSCADLRPDRVTLVEGDTLRSIPAGEAKPGDILSLRPGDRIPLDGRVLTGESRIDTSAITGEPVPRSVRPGDSLISGCVNTGGQLTMVVEKPLSESMVSRILSSMENAAATKPKMDRFITRFARVYTPVVVAVAAITAIIPSLITGDWGYWVYTALSFLVMSCPCALVLSVPLAFFSGIGAGSKQGILFKSGLSLEAMAQIRAVVMDKTGTLTKGEFRAKLVSGDEEMLRLCASCEQQSSHPIAVSIVAAAKESGLSLSLPESLEEIPGRGIRATILGKQLLCGNRELLESQGIPVEIHEIAGGTYIYIALEGSFAGVIAVSDTVKEEAQEAVKELKAMGMTTAILTGDEQESAQAVADRVGIEKVFARQLPEEKLWNLQNMRREYGPVMFVGDGINDAPVLAGADVGAAMGSGADAAIEAADVVFLTSRVSAIGEALKLARRVKAIAWQNLIFALVIKLAVMVLGLLGFASMWLAVFADSGVAMLCVLNAIRILYRKENRR